MKVVWTLVAVAAVIVAIGAVVMFTGVYNVAANDPHNALVRWALATTRVNSVQARAAEEVAVPPGLGEPEVIEAGARKYARMCAQCHGSPAADGLDWAEHMLPEPPEMGHVAEFWEPQAIYWIIENGFKMTGMPAWGALMEPEEIWHLVAFVEAYPQLSAEDYGAMIAPDAAATQEDAGPQAAGPDGPGEPEPDPEPEPEPEGAE